MIKQATFADIPKFLEIAKIMHAEGSYKNIPFEDEVYVVFLKNIMAKDSYALWLYEIQGETVGALIGAIGPFMFNPLLQAADMGLYVKKSKRGSLAASRLVAAYETWAAEKGVIRICLGSSNGYDKAGAFFERMGYTFAGVSYYKNIG